MSGCDDRTCSESGTTCSPKECNGTCVDRTPPEDGYPCTDGGMCNNGTCAPGVLSFQSSLYVPANSMVHLIYCTLDGTWFIVSKALPWLVSKALPCKPCCCFVAAPHVSRSTRDYSRNQQSHKGVVAYAVSLARAFSACHLHLLGILHLYKTAYD